MFWPLAILSKCTVQGRTALGSALIALAVATAGCTDKTEAVPETGVDYYPVALNNFWTYAVTDSTWTQAQASPFQPSALQVDKYEFRETITESFKDAAGQTAYRMVRAKRIPPATTWVDDSVFTLSATAQSVILNRNNQRTLELIFPVRDGRLWNFNAYNNNSNDTVTAETRRYSRVGQSFTTTTGTTTLAYPTTLTTTNEGLAKSEDIYYTKTYQQVYAKTIGPVLRRRRRFANFYLVGSTNVFVPNSYFYGFSRNEVLTAYGLH